MASAAFRALGTSHAGAIGCHVCCSETPLVYSVGVAGAGVLQVGCFMLHQLLPAWFAVNLSELCCGQSKLVSCCNLLGISCVVCKCTAHHDSSSPCMQHTDSLKMLVQAKCACMRRMRNAVTRHAVRACGGMCSSPSCTSQHSTGRTTANPQAVHQAHKHT